MRRNEHQIPANMSVTACRVCGANYIKYSVAWILSSCHKSLAKVFTGTMAMAVSVYTQANVSYSAQNKDTCLLLAPFRSKCCHLDFPLLMNWAFAPQLGVLIPQRVIGRQSKRVLLDCSPGYGEVHKFWLFGDSVNILAMRTSDSVISREYTYIFLTRWIPRSTLSKRCLHAVVHTTP